MGMGGIKSWFKSQYDKLVAIFILMGLLLSLLYLAVRIGMMNGEQKSFDKWTQNIKIEHPTVAPVNSELLNNAAKKVMKPFQLAPVQWTNTLFVPETRVWCVDCRRPIPYFALTCPFCMAKQPAIPMEKLRDSDGDGMPDWWELQYGLDPFDASDADKDIDGDGFSNLFEYQAGTDPTDPQSHPTLESLLRLDEIIPEPFKLRFKAVTTLPDGVYQFQINLKDDKKTYFVKMNEEVDKEDFKVVNYVPQFTNRFIPGIGTQVVDVSVLTLQRGDKLIPLTKGEKVVWKELKARITLELDKSEYTVHQDDSVELKWKNKKPKYTVIKIDMEDQSVLIRRADDNKDFTVRKTLEFETKKSPETDR
jgi:hypothetical protein